MNEMGPLLITALLLIAFTLHHRLSRSAQPLRLELAEKGEALLAMPGISKEMRGQVAFMLDSAFGARLPLLFGVILFVFILPIFLLSDKVRIDARRASTSPDPEIQRRFEDVCRTHDRITMANNPVLWMLLELEILLALPIVLLGIAVLRGHLPRRINRNEVMGFVETLEPRLLAKRAA